VTFNDWLSLVTAVLVVTTVVSFVGFIVIREWLTDRYVTRVQVTTAAERAAACARWEHERMLRAHAERIHEPCDQPGELPTIIDLDALGSGK